MQTYACTCITVTADGCVHVHSAKKFLDTSKGPIVPEMFHIRPIKSVILEAGGCLLHFDTKLVRFG